ncbi:MAG: PDC sensor domain-containing protein [Rhodomicrobiaceae bacterium]
MFWRKLTIIAALSGIVLGAAPAKSEEAHVSEVKKYVAEQVIPWISDKLVIDAIKAQNEKHASLTQDDIDRLDKQWMAEIDASDKPLINSLLNNELSKFLAEKRAASAGLITEIFVMDDKGLNVGQSDITSDYWQGDEAKWQKTYSVGPEAVFVDNVEKDESTQKLQVQISMSIKDPESGKAIGAVTIGIDVTMLLS